MKLKTKGITKPLTSVLQLHPKRELGPKKRFMMDKHIPEKPGGTEPLPVSRATLQETATASCQTVCCAPHPGGMGDNSGFWCRIKVTKLFPEAATL